MRSQKRAWRNDSVARASSCLSARSRAFSTPSYPPVSRMRPSACAASFAVSSVGPEPEGFFPVESSGGVWESLTSVQRFVRSEEHTSELQSLMRISYAVFCLKKKNKQKDQDKIYRH